MNRWSARKNYFWQEAPFFRLLLLLMAGIVCYDRLWIAGSYLSAAVCVLMGSGLTAIALAPLRSRNTMRNTAQAIGFCLFFFTLGWYVNARSDIRNNGTWFGHRLNKHSLSVVVATENPQARGSIIKLPVSLLAVVDSGRSRNASGPALLYLYRKPVTQISAGDTLLIPSDWQPIRNSGNPFAFDNVSSQRRKNIFFRQSTAPANVIIIGHSGNHALLQRAHDWCARQLSAYIRDTTALGLLQAMLLGDEGGLDDELRQAYSQTGVIHIVSISGSHVAVLYLVVIAALFWIKGRKGSWIKCILSLVLVWMYVLVAGAPPSAVRSALMFSVLALSAIANREGNAINTVSGAAFIMLLYQPAWLFSIGFQLSFGAVLSMLLFYRPLYRLYYRPQKYRLTRWMWQTIAASLAAEILTAPLVIYYFHNFPLTFLIANLLASVLAGLCALIGGIAIIVFSWFPALDRLIGAMVSFTVQVFNDAIIWLQGLNLQSLQHLQITGAELILIYLVIAAAGIWRLRQNRRGLIITLAAGSLLLMLLVYDQYQSLAQERLIAYSNGHTACVELIRSKYFHTIAGTGTSYAVEEAHNGYHAWRKSSADSLSPYFAIGGKKVLVLSDSACQSYIPGLPVDVLIIARPLMHLRPGDLIQAFCPREIVLATKPPAYCLPRWADSCAAHSIHLSNVADDGAYIIE
jgi:competence protein ComEC